MDKQQLFNQGKDFLSQAEEYLDIDMCDDGLVFHYLQKSAEFLLKALGKEFNLDIDNTSLSEIIKIIENKTTIRFPEFINIISEMDETVLSTGCSTGVCFDMDFYGDYYEAVKQLEEFVEKYLEE